MKDYVVFKYPMFHGLLCFTVSLLLFLAAKCFDPVYCTGVPHKFTMLTIAQPDFTAEFLSYNIVSGRVVSIEFVDVWVYGFKIS